MTKVKVCGISQVSHAVAAADAGADFIGLIFAPSERQVKPEGARELVREAKALRSSIGQRPAVVGVFVNVPAKEINQIAEYCGLDRVQLHGDETLEDCSAIEKPILKVVRIRAEEPANQLIPRLNEELKAIRDRGYVPMLDTASTGQYYGGTGRPFDWRAASQLAQRYQILLSGGLSPDNVAQAIEQVRPWGVDASSGLETDGIKDIKKIRSFLQTVTDTDAQLKAAVEG